MILSKIFSFLRLHILLYTYNVSILFAFNDFYHFPSGQCAQPIGLAATLSTGATPTATFAWQTTSRPAPAREPPSAATTTLPRITGAAVTFYELNARAQVFTFKSSEEVMSVLVQSFIAKFFLLEYLDDQKCLDSLNKMQSSGHCIFCF
jgi:hypothetical protein